MSLLDNAHLMLVMPTTPPIDAETSFIKKGSYLLQLIVLQWDHVFVYSDMQAGHGGLYGTGGYDAYRWKNGRHIDVPKLIAEYRRTVNPNVHVYLVQVAGYQDTLVPEVYAKTHILGGWGDGILRYAARMASLEDGPSQEGSVIQAEDAVQAVPAVVVSAKKRARKIA